MWSDITLCFQLQSMGWRDEVGADSILKTWKSPKILEKHYPGGICGEDRTGRPLWLDPLGRADLKGNNIPASV